MKKIPVRNYIIYACICVVTILLLFFFVNIVKQIQISKGSVLSNFLHEVNNEDVLINLSNYAVDNPNFYLYIANSADEEFEEEFRKYIIEHGLKTQIVYFNAYNKLDKKFIKEFKRKFFSSELQKIDEKSLIQSNLYTYEDGKIVDVLYENSQKINLIDVKIYMERNGEIVYD